MTKRRRAYRKKNTPARQVRQAAFLAAFGKCATIFHAAKSARINRETHYEWMRTDPDYVKRFGEAKEESDAFLIDCARKRATRTKKPSDTLLIFLMKGAMPDVYRERFDTHVTGSVEHTGQITIVQIPATQQDDS